MGCPEQPTDGRAPIGQISKVHVEVEAFAHMP